MFIHQCKISPPIKGYTAHCHSCWEIVCQLEGEAITTVGEKVFTLKPGDVFLTPPGITHSGRSDTEFTDLSLCAEGIDFNKPCVFHDAYGDVTSIIMIIQRLMTERQGDYLALAEGLTEQVAKIIRYEQGISSDTPFVEQLKREMYNNLSNADFSIADAVASIGFNKDYFRRCFKAATGKTPAEYLTELRLSRAKQLLTDPKMFTVSSVAESCGFSDNLYFSTCFKKHVGVSPKEFRNRSLKKNDTKT